MMSEQLELRGSCSKIQGQGEELVDDQQEDGRQEEERQVLD